jgi:hypothetical protein
MGWLMLDLQVLADPPAHVPKAFEQSIHLGL